MGPAVVPAHLPQARCGTRWHPRDTIKVQMSTKAVSVVTMQGDLTQLTSLDVSENQLASVPGELRGCSSLQRLKLVGNALEELPEQWGPWRALAYLDIR